MRDALDWMIPLALISLCTGIASQSAGAREHETTTRTFGNDVFMAGSDVRITDGSPGDAMLAGGWISTS